MNHAHTGQLPCACTYPHCIESGRKHMQEVIYCLYVCIPRLPGRGIRWSAPLRVLWGKHGHLLSSSTSPSCPCLRSVGYWTCVTPRVSSQLYKTHMLTCLVVRNFIVQCLTLHSKFGVSLLQRFVMVLVIVTVEILNENCLRVGACPSNCISAKAFEKML